MTDIFQALKTLKQDIDAINRAPLEQNNNGLENVATAKKLFINRDIIPKGVEIPAGLPSQEDINDYSKHVLQALWNIAHYSSSSTYISAFLKLGSIQANFRYLDISWVPKIIDERTYKLGKVLQNYLLKALTPEALSTIPELLGARSSVESKLTTMQAILNKRLAIYEAHQPAKIKETIELIASRDALKEKWLPAQKTFLTAIKIDTAKNLNILREGLHSESSTQLKSKLHEIEQQIAQYEQAAASFKKFNDQWLEESLKVKLPEQVISSPYIQLLAQKPLLNSQIIRELKLIYNTDYTLIEEPIGADLTNTHSTGLRLMEEHSVIQNMLNTQKQLIEAQLEDSKSLDIFVQNLKQKVITAPAFIIPVALENYINHPERELSNDIPFYKAKRGELETYQAALLNYKGVLGGEKPRSLPSIKDANNKRFFEHALNMPIQLVDERLASVQKSLRHTNLTIHRLEDDHVKETEQGRKDQLAAARQRIKVAFELTHNQTGIKEKNGIRGLSQFLEERYEPAVAELDAKALPQISALNKILEDTDKQIKIKSDSLVDIKKRTAKRQELLVKAKAELLSYKGILTRDNNIYLSAKKISLADLKYYLEGDRPVNAFIDEVYRIARSSESWGGVNISNLSNILNHYTSNQGESSADVKLKAMVEHISKKIDFIDNEMARAANNIPHRVEHNLWSLQSRYQQDEQKLKELMALKQIKSVERDDLLKAHKEQMEQWNQEKIKKEQMKCLSSVEHLIALIDHRNAQISFNSYELEFNLADIEKEQIYLTSELTRIETMQPKEALEVLVPIQEKGTIKAIDFKLQIRIADKLSSQQKELAKLREMEKLLVTKPEKIRLDIKKLEDEINELVEKKIRLDALITQVSNSKMNLQVVNEKIAALRAMQKPVIPAAILPTAPPVVIEAIVPDSQPKASGPTLAGIHQQFFSTTAETGIFNQYLKDRAQEYWFADFFRDFAALVFGCFYKSDSQRREEYITELEHTYNAFQSNDIWDADELLKLIKEGQQQFPSRKSESDKSLYSKLESFKGEINKIMASVPPEQRVNPAERM